MRTFGELIGIAFQIKDDLLDYGDADIGKPTGIDIKERKMTLPLISMRCSRQRKRQASYHPYCSYKQQRPAKDPGGDRLRETGRWYRLR